MAMTKNASSPPCADMEVTPSITLHSRVINHVDAYMSLGLLDSWSFIQLCENPKGTHLGD